MQASNADDPELCCYRDEVKTTYESYVANGGDGHNVLELRGETLGYDSNFLERCNIITANNENDVLKRKAKSAIYELFMAFCGSGCPLRKIIFMSLITQKRT